MVWLSVGSNKRIAQEELIDMLRDVEDKLVIVEGKKDKKALKSLGVKNIIAINGRPLYELADEIKTDKEVVILTDFDKEGRKIHSKLKNLLQRHKIHVNSHLRGRIMSLGKNKIEDFGVLNSRVSFKEVDVHVKARTEFNKISDKGSNKCKRSNRET